MQFERRIRQTAADTAGCQVRSDRTKDDILRRNSGYDQATDQRIIPSSDKPSSGQISQGRIWDFRNIVEFYKPDSSQIVLRREGSPYNCLDQG